MSRLLLALALVTIGTLAAAAGARAEDAVVVLDRGSGSEAAADANIRLATRLVEALRARETRTRLIVVGTRASGRLRAAELRGTPATALAAAVEREGFRFEGATDPRVALEVAVRRVGDVGDLSVFLVGAFAGEDENEEERAEEARDALAKWSAKAPETSRIFTLGLAEDRRALLADAKGSLVDGALVLGTGDVAVDAQAFSPLAEDDAARPELEAEIRVPLEMVPSGRGSAGALLTPMSRLPRDEFEALTDADGALGFRMRRHPDDGRVATIAFTVPPTPGLLWLTEPPLPRTFSWTKLLPDARLEARSGGPPLPFEVTEAWLGEPHTVGYRLVRTRAATTPDWKARSEGDPLPPGFDVTFGEEVAADEETTFRDVSVTFTASPRTVPLEFRGTLVIESADHPSSFRIPFHVRVPQGMVVVKLEAPAAPQPLPPTEEDPWWLLVVEAQNANVPPIVSVEWRVDPPLATDGLAVEMEGRQGRVVWPLGVNGMLEPGFRYRVRPTLWPASGQVPPAALSLVLGDEAHVAGVAEGSGRIRPRRPALVVAEEPWSYRVEAGRVVGDPPLRLRLDADGGGGDWRLALLSVPPIVSVPPGTTVSWEVRPEGAGEWLLVPGGSWEGERPDAFSGRTDPLRVRVDWSRGAAPGTLDIPLRVPPRWGAAGWILVVLAGLALALGGWGIYQLRPPPVTGTMLYTLPGRKGAVGRLDLEGVGRQAAEVRADTAGRLHVGGSGAVLFRVRATRIGGMLVLPGEGEDHEHLLVDGLTIDAGRHRVRYVSGDKRDERLPPAAAATEDLLGPDFDLPTGRFDQLTAKRVQEEGGADPPPGRS